MSEETPSPAQRLYDSPQSVAAVEISTPANIQTLRASDPDPLQKLYPNTVAPSINAWMQQQPGAIPTEQRQAMGKEWQAMGRDVGLGANDLADMLQRSNQSKQFTPEQIGQNQAKAMRDLENEYGPRASAAYADALKLMQRDERMGRVLKDTNLQHDPQTVMTFARKAQEQKARGRL